MLSELRKYRLGIVSSTQFTAQLSKETLESVLGNVGTLISFGVGANDAALLARQFATDIPSQRDLATLPNCRVFVQLMISGKLNKPFSGSLYRT